MILVPEDWHNRFSQQARWTKSIRDFIYATTNISGASHILEVGCGSGAILTELSQTSDAIIHGLDINETYLSLARENSPNTALILADAHHIPIADRSYNLTVCHFLLLWVTDPKIVINEMVRVTTPGGYVCILAEPDYGGRIDFPEQLSTIAAYQTQALRDQGANPYVGRQLRSLLQKAGLTNVIAGVLGGQWTFPFELDEWELEWDVLENDLAYLPDAQQHYVTQKALDRTAWVNGERVLYVPTFYAWGLVSG